MWDILWYIASFMRNVFGSRYMEIVYKSLFTYFILYRYDLPITHKNYTYICCGNVGWKFLNSFECYNIHLIILLPWVYNNPHILCIWINLNNLFKVCINLFTKCNVNIVLLISISIYYSYLVICRFRNDYC